MISLSTDKKTKIVIGVLTVLLVLSLSLLVFGVMRVFQRSMAKTSVRDNNIGAVEKEWKMELTGMLPGDTTTKYYEVELKQKGDVYLYFQADIAQTTNHLENALSLKVENRGTNFLLCEGRLSDIAGQAFREKITDDTNKDERQMYKITVSMDTSAGNEYQNSSLTLNFEWTLRNLTEETQ